MLITENVIGQKQDWANYITNRDEHQTPLLRRLPKGSKPVSKLHNYQVDKHEDPRDIAFPDGKDWSTFDDAARYRAELKARVQFVATTGAVSKMAEDVTDVPGVRGGELAREIDKKLIFLGRSIECAIGSDQAAQEYAGEAVPDKCQGMGLWIQSGVTSQTYPTPADYRPSSSNIYSGAKASLVENDFRSLLQARWNATGDTGDNLLVCGASLKNVISGFPFYIPSSASTQSTARVSNRDISSGTIGQSIDRYESEFGNFDIVLSKWLAHANFGGTSGKSAWRGYGLSLNMWEIRWNQMPQVYKPEFKGGGYKFAIDAIVMWLCKNPIAELKIDPSDA